MAGLATDSGGGCGRDRSTGGGSVGSLAIFIVGGSKLSNLGFGQREGWEDLGFGQKGGWEQISEEV
jgi:hypothetical protein